MFWRKKPQQLKYESLLDFERSIQSMMCNKERDIINKMENNINRIDAILQEVDDNDVKMKEHIVFHAKTFRKDKRVSDAFETSLLSQQRTNTKENKRIIYSSLVKLLPKEKALLKEIRL